MDIELAKGRSAGFSRRNRELQIDRETIFVLIWIATLGFAVRHTTGSLGLSILWDPIEWRAAGGLRSEKTIAMSTDRVRYNFAFPAEYVSAKIQDKAQNSATNLVKRFGGPW